MRLLRASLVVGLLVSGAGVAGGVTAGPAVAHTHPTPVELDSPAVVRVQTYAQVHISLIEHNLVGQHIPLTQRTYTPLLASGSGFAVNPSGGIVTSASVVDVDDADLRRAETYAVNRIFNERYRDRAPLPADPFTTQTIRDRDPLDRVNERLQQCYHHPNASNASGGCVVFSTRVVKVLPFVLSQKKFGDLSADVLTPRTGKQAGDVVVLKVGASSMPTVELASRRGAAKAFSVLGFSKTPSDGRSLRKIEGHLTGPGATRVARDKEYSQLLAGGQNGMQGGPVVGERGEVLGFLSQPSNSAQSGASPELTLVGPEPIRAALSAAGIRPDRGPTDAVYESAMHNYKNRLYAPAIPHLTQVLKLYPGHTLAAEALADANRKKGTNQDAGSGAAQTTQTGPEAGSSPSLLLLVLGPAAIVALVVFLLFTRRRSSPSSPPPSDHTGGASGSVSAWPEQRPRFPAQTRTDSADSQEMVTPSRAAVHPAPASTHSGPSLGPRPEADSRGSASAPIPEQPDPSISCARCGQPVSPTQEFCGHCGLRVR